MSQLNEDVVEELEALQEIGITVSKECMELATNGDLTEYDNMGVSALADLLLLIYG